MYLMNEIEFRDAIFGIVFQRKFAIKRANKKKFIFFEIYWYKTTLKESCINKNAPDGYHPLKIEEYDKQRKNLTLKCTSTYSHTLHRERHIVTDDISIEDNDSFGRDLLTEKEKLINYARYCLKLANTLNYARIDYTEEVVSVPMLDLNSEILIDELVVESELCVANTSCHDNGLSNELAVIYPPIVTMKPCAILREMEKVFNDACNLKLRDINLSKVLSKSKNKHKTAKIYEISSHNELKRPSTDEIENSTNFRKKRSIVNHMPGNYCQTGLPTQITEGNLYKIRSSVKKIKEKHSCMETEARDVINLGQRNHKSNRIK